MSESTSSGAHESLDSCGKLGDSGKRTPKAPRTPKNSTKPVSRRMIANYEYRLTLPFYCADDDKEMIKLAYLELPSHGEISTGICHNLLMRKADFLYVPCTFKSNKDGEYSWPVVHNKAQGSSAVVPAKPDLVPPAWCKDCTLNERPNLKVDLGYLDIHGAVSQTKLDDKHTVILLFHASSRFYPFCMEFTYSPIVPVYVSINGSNYPCWGKPAKIRVKPEDRSQALSVTVLYHNKTYVVEHPNFQFGNDIAFGIGFGIESKRYKIELSDSNMRTLPNPKTISGLCYFKTIGDSTGSSAYYFMKTKSDRELIQISAESEPVFNQEEWSSSDRFKAQATSLLWVLSERKVDLQEEYLRFGVSGTVVIQSADIHKTHRLFKPFLVSHQKAFILEKVAKLKVLCTSLELLEPF